MATHHGASARPANPAGDTARIQWKIAGEEAVACNCAWGCPCQFNALPTHGNCQASSVHEIRKGNYGSTSLDGLRFVQIVSWPGALHEGNGIRLIIIDERATPEQRSALSEMTSGRQGGAYFEIFAAICPRTQPPVFKSIEFQVDRQGRTAKLKVAGLVEFATEPIKNPVSGEEHRARIVLPQGFEYTEAEMGNTTHLAATGGGELGFDYDNSYAQLNAFDWSN